MKVGDLIRVNKLCDAGGLWHRVGVVLDIEHTGRIRGLHGDIVEGMRVHVMMDGRQRRFAGYSLDVISACTSCSTSSRIDL